MKSNDPAAIIQKTNHIRGDGPNWIFIIGGALLSTLSIKIGYRLKLVFDRRRLGTAKGLGNPEVHRRAEACRRQDEEDACYQCQTDGAENQRLSTSSRVEDTDSSLQPVANLLLDSNKENNGVTWASSRVQIEFPQQRPLHHSNSSESPCISESGSDIFNKREVVYKLRQQLKRRDEMIVEMQTQLSDLQGSLTEQMACSTDLQSQLDLANRDLFESEREILHLQKAIAGHAAARERASPKMLASAPAWHAETNGHSNGYADNCLDLHPVGAGKRSKDGLLVEMLKDELQELKEVIQGKEFLLQSYKEQKVELSTKLKEMQLRLASSHVPNML